MPGVDIDYVVIDKSTGAEVVKDKFKIADDEVSFGWSP